MPWPARPTDPSKGWVRLGDVPEPKSPPFIVEDLIHDTSNLMYGRPKSGKSYLLLTLAESLSTGKPWLGREVRERRSVAFWMLDSGQVDESKDRSRTLDPALGGVLVSSVRPGHDEREWRRHAETLADLGIDFLIIDNLFKLMPSGRSVRNDEHIGDVLRNIDAMESCGIAVLLNHHLGKPGEDGSSPQSPLGSTALEGGFRHFVRVEHDRKDSSREIVSYGNRLKIPELRVPFEISDSGVESTQDRDAVRDRERLSRVIGRPWENQEAIAKAIGLDQGQVSRLLTRMGVKRDRGSGLIVYRDSGAVVAPEGLA
jgi:hypothetical protein